MKRTIIFIFAAALGAALFISASAADTSFPIYFPNAKLVVKADVVDRTVYLPIKEIVQQMAVPYTDALALETLTLRSGNNRLVVTKNSGLISYNNQIVLLPNWILRDNNRWLAPVEFFTMGLSRLTGTDFRYRAGSSRVFVGNVEAPELEMNAQTLGPITRLTIRCAVPIKLDVKRDSTKAVLAIDRAPLDPTRERFDHRDRLLHSVLFDDSDGESKIVLDMTREVADLRVTSADNNRIFFVDLIRTGEPITAAPPPAGEPPAAAKPDVVPGERKVRVVVVDPGHGGADPGGKGMGVVEKDFTLALARKLKAGLQTRLGATVLLTRDSDASMDSEARSAVANNNQANLLISLHAGYSLSRTDSGTSIFIMKDDFGTASASSDVSRDQMFLPWYLGYRAHHQASAAAATMLQEELNKAIPAWKVPVRTAPLAVLSSATMPSLLLEVGNLNNPNNAQTLLDAAFQNRLVDSIVEAVRRFSESPKAAAN
jgi:N-acetylmuramoyl-L-alanine amidase